MACHNGACHLGDAMASVLAQRDVQLELLVCDDASTDESSQIVQTAMDGDDRVRLLTNDAPIGPGGARNLGLNEARGTWIAVVDADDLIHPDRFARLLRSTDEFGADVIADDLVRFGAESGTTLLEPLRLRSPWCPSAEDLLTAGLGRRATPVGYLKPIVRRSALGDLRYQTDLPIGEDFDLLLRLSLSAAKIVVVPEPLYLYRRHARSTSHRFSSAQCEAMAAGINRIAQDFPSQTANVSEALDSWRAMLKQQAAFGDLVNALKGLNVATALRMFAQTPGLFLPLLRSAREGLARRMTPSPGARRNLTPLVLTDGPYERSGEVFRVPSKENDWTPSLAAALAARTSCGARHIRAVGRPGLGALGYVPGWRLVEMVPPDEGWTPCEEELIASLIWPVLPQNSDPSSDRSSLAA